MISFGLDYWARKEAKFRYTNRRIREKSQDNWLSSCNDETREFDWVTWVDIFQQIGSNKNIFQQYISNGFGLVC